MNITVDKISAIIARRFNEEADAIRYHDAIAEVLKERRGKKIDARLAKAVEKKLALAEGWR